MRDVWQKDNALIIQEFLTPQALSALRQETANAKVWRKESQPDQRSYEQLIRPHRCRDIGRFAKFITGTQPLRSPSLRLRQKSYTLLHDAELQKQGVVALLFLDDWNENAGGDLVMVKDGKTLLRVTPAKNTLVLIRRPNGAHTFWRYVNHLAGKRLLRVLSA